ncbi:platelet glycoprotein Ib alpha chain [Carassius gibelio]|uniref:platelet glycoprotein Ib alpha chain n=1 Tax=Carassius gibelio TaxID=101364 RepID=UPI002277E518|nr:platelet glycoprotein Ib alpha chain [Carassius gibelio]XP_052450950.1 platelet glycoprotein Ib alpha chain [Carassius gibelio]XP_052450952.1 platelet glycoprotein Ib alpha chain [Carassius gibelio]
MPCFIILVFLLIRCFIFTSSSCQSDRNQDHRPRVSCVGQGLTAVPQGIHTDTQVLVLTGNQFTSLSWSMYSGFTELHELDLSHNHISTLEPPGPVLEKLSVLRLSGNMLTGLGGLVFRCAPSLMEIYLDRNQIRSLHDGTFSDLPRLEVINLSQNKLPVLPPRLLERVSSSGLKTFDLENNSVSLMPDGFFSSKPELPYVYLTHNPWLCSCAVGYLHSFLNDQEHNIYMHEGPNDIIPAADSVLCSGPPHLLRRPIIELEESDFCPPDITFPNIYIRGDVDLRHTPVLPEQPDISYTSRYTSERPDTGSPSHLPTISVKPISSTQALIAPYLTTIHTHLHDSTKSWTSIETYWVTETWTEIWYKIWTEYVIWTPIPNTFVPSQNTAEPTTWRTDTSQPTTNELPTTAPMITTGQPEPHTLTFTTNFRPITDQSQPQSTAQPEPAMITVQTSRRVIRPHWTEAQEVSGRLLPWCWWLFAGFLLLCVLSALTSCVLFLWLLRNLVIYRRLKRHIWPSRVTLRAYRRTLNTPLGSENEAESVSFLPREQIRDAQAVFRSVLFISRDEQMTETEDVSSVTELARDKEVFRKTLYREMSTEQEAGGWMEEVERWGNARYSLILREERGPQRERKWLVGEWEMGGGGVACERPCSLIGQPSTVALE